VRDLKEIRVLHFGYKA